MQTIKGQFNPDYSRDTYWMRVLIQSADSNKKTFLFICASYEYLENTLCVSHFDDTTLNRWADTFVESWTSKGNHIFKKPFHMEVCALTEKGRKNGIEFLKKEIIPMRA